MRAKDRFLEKNNQKKILILILFFLFNFSIEASDNKKYIFEYTKNLKNFSANFIQSDGTSIEEGAIYIGEKRVRIDYLKPTKITIILDKNKAMYANYALEEAQYFNTKKSEANIFFEILKNENFFSDAIITSKNKNIFVKKKYSNNNIDYIANLIFEEKPFVLRKINLSYNNTYQSINFTNHNFFEDFNKKFFSLANPFLNN